MTALWLGLAHWLVHHPALGAPIRRIGRVAAPVVLIGIGVMVLVEAGMLSWLTGWASPGGGASSASAFPLRAGRP